MSGKIGLYTGSFDPVTNGHMDMIKRASHLFEHVYVGIFNNPNKQGFFTFELRAQMLREAVCALPNVTVVSAKHGLAVDLARELSVTHLIRGLRNTADFDYEAGLEYFNHRLAPDIETIYLMATHDLQPISSSRIRELIAFRASITGLVPQAVINQVEKMNENNKKI